MAKPTVSANPDLPPVSDSLGTNRGVRISKFVIVVHDQHRRSDNHIFPNLNVVLGRNDGSPTDSAALPQSYLRTSLLVDDYIEPDCGRDRHFVANLNES
jgi:hypothetical protein